MSGNLSIVFLFRLRDELSKSDLAQQRASCLSVLFKVGVYLKAVFWLGMIMVLTHYLVHVSSGLFTHPTDSCFGLFCKFCGDFCLYLEIMFLKGFVKFMEKENFEDLVLL